MLRRRPIKQKPETEIDPETTRFKKWDWIVAGIFFVVVSVMMFSTFSMKDGNVQVANHQSSDFGSTVSIMQSFAVGRNFPTEFPHFSGDRIRYHFLFYFQAGNLEYLGFSPTFSNNLLSVLSLWFLLILIMTLGNLLFASRVVGRIGAAFFFFHGSLAYITFFLANGSVSSILSKIWDTHDFLSSRLGYRGEDWGVWSQVVYLNQRHLASAIGLFLLVLVYLVIRYKDLPEPVRIARPAAKENELPPVSDGAVDDEPEQPSNQIGSDDLPFDQETEASDEELLTPTEQNEESDPDSIDDDASPDSIELEVPAETSEVQNNDLLELPAVGEASGLAESTEAIDAQEKYEIDDSVRLEVEGLPDEPETPIEVSETDETIGSEPGEEDVEEMPVELTAEGIVEQEDLVPEKKVDLADQMRDLARRSAPFIFCGVLLGLMPLWNGAVFTGAAAVLFALLVLFPLRKEMVVLAIASGLIAMPQIIFLKTGLLRPPDFSLLHWGYTIDHPTLYNVFYYLIYTFGFKWLLIVVALIFATRFQRLFMIAVTTLAVVPLCFQFSDEVLANHKFFNMWLVLINIPVAFGLLKVWNLIPGRAAIIGRIAAIILVILIITGGVIDFFPIKNSFWVVYRYENDPLVEWIDKNTDPNSIFLSHRFINHPILLSGRRLFYGHPYYAYTAGYPTYQRDVIYKKMFESMDVGEVFRLLKENKIDYVAIDNAVRKGDVIKKCNEKLYEAYFPLVFTDTDNKYDNLKIYAVPDVLGPPNPDVEVSPEITMSTPGSEMTFSAFEGGQGDGLGQFAGPRGVTVDAKENIYVADTGNGRVEKFDEAGKFVASYGRAGSGEGEFKEPNGVVIDDSGNLYITDAGNQKLIKLGPDGKFLNEWSGSDPGFYGPRDIAIGPNKQIYIVDQGRTRIVVLDPSTEKFRSWGSAGNGDGQFNEPTGIAIGGGQVFVADSGNGRIQVFDLEGQFVRQWEIPVWQRTSAEFPDLVFDEQSKRLFVTCGMANEILAFGVDGTPITDFKAESDTALKNPSSIVLQKTGKTEKLIVVNTAGNRLSSIPLK